MGLPIDAISQGQTKHNIYIVSTEMEFVSWPTSRISCLDTTRPDYTTGNKNTHNMWVCLLTQFPRDNTTHKWVCLLTQFPKDKTTQSTYIVSTEMEFVSWPTSRISCLDTTRPDYTTGNKNTHNMWVCLLTQFPRDNTTHKWVCLLTQFPKDKTTQNTYIVSTEMEFVSWPTSRISCIDTTRPD